jgi:YhcH/YjgK/YiaL family protein
MIYDTLPEMNRYCRMSENFAAAFDYLARAASGDYALGRTEIIPGEVWAIAVRKAGRSAELATFEYHERFADIQFCPTGRDEFGWHDGMAGLEPTVPFNPESDNGLLAGPAKQFLPLHGNRFAVLFPREPHAPHISPNEITRICIKVRMN